jgi:hypothetical protein
MISRHLPNFILKVKNWEKPPWAVALSHISPNTRTYSYNSPNGIISVLSISHPPTYLKRKWLESIPSTIPVGSGHIESAFLYNTEIQIVLANIRSSMVIPPVQVTRG